MSPVDVLAWHEVECGPYSADLPLWAELAEAGDGPVLELGCGAGRVALDLARRGHEVVGIDVEPTLVAELDSRAAEEGLAARAIVADAAVLGLDRRFALAIAPMQLVQLLAGPPARRAMLDGVVSHLEPGGTLACAIVESHMLPDPDSGAGLAPPLPDVREIDGWVYSSLPLDVRRANGRLAIERLRQTVSPGGDLSEQVDITELAPLSPEALEAEARDAGLRPAGRREVASTDWHVGSTVCVLEVA